MSSTDPMQTVRLAERSLRCLGLGILGLFPLFGLPLAALAGWIGYEVLRESGRRWNPARVHAMIGMSLGLLSLLVQIGAVFGGSLLNRYFLWILSVWVGR